MIRSRPGSISVLVALIVLASSVFVCACAPPVSDRGRATVLDGDSLEIGSASVRLYGVDAPEGQQTCSREDVTWRCGRAAAEKLRELVGANEITCREMDTDSYGRSVAVCSNGTVDLSAAMAAAGLALAYRRYSDDYVDEEDEARVARRGMWAGTFVPPWEWRRDREEPALPEPPGPAAALGLADEPPAHRPGCDIKGNINDRGDRIYHVPGSRSYTETQINRLGERWFCTVQEAENAGWRAPRAR